LKQSAGSWEHQREQRLQQVGLLFRVRLGEWSQEQSNQAERRWQHNKNSLAYQTENRRLSPA